MARPPLVTVVIPTVRGRTWLPACLNALRAQTFRDFDIFIIDNASTDGTRNWLSAQSDVHVIRNETNVGFAAACNQGMRASRSPFIALLNDDTRADAGWLEALVSEVLNIERRVPHGQSTPDIHHMSLGACASLMLYADRPDMVQSAGISMDRAAIAWDRLGGRHVSDAQAACDVFGASGGACLYRRAMLDAIGLFDERFFAYLEDVDLAWRAQRAGWRCVYVPQARVLHYTSATGGEGSPFKQRLLGRNKQWMVAKNARMRDLPLIVLYDLLGAVASGVARGNWAHVRGRIVALRHLRGTQEKPLTATNAHVPFDPLVAPWQVSKRFARGLG